MIYAILLTYLLIKEATSLPTLQPGGAATALLALILCAYLISSSDDIFPPLALPTELSFCFA